MMGRKMELCTFFLLLLFGGINSAVPPRNSKLELYGVKADEIMPMSKSYASARILLYPNRNNISPHDYQLNTKEYLNNMDGEGLNKIEPFFVDRRLFKEVPEDIKESDSSSFQNYDGPVKERFQLQELHLRYLMASTVEQPDNSGRSSSFNIWLTILIAALAAAILS